MCSFIQRWSCLATTARSTYSGYTEAALWTTLYLSKMCRNQGARGIVGSGKDIVEALHMDTELRYKEPINTPSGSENTSWDAPFQHQADFGRCVAHWVTPIACIQELHLCLPAIIIKFSRSIYSTDTTVRASFLSAHRTAQTKSWGACVYLFKQFL